MEIPIQLILFAIPSLIYAAVQRRRNASWPEIFTKLGWKGSPARYFLWGAAIGVVLGGLAWLAFQLIPPEVFQNSNVNTARYAGWPLNATTVFLIFLREGIYTTLGEEVFFRGFLGGWLIRRFGFWVGNLLQTVIFLLPHLLLLLVSVQLWGLVVVQALSGWFLGWLRYRSDSILPGWLLHTLGNTAGALATLL